MDAGMDSLSFAVVIASSATVALAGFLYFRKKGNTIAESGAYGLMVQLMVQSWLSQVLLMIGWQRWFVNLQTIFIAAAMGFILSHKRMIISQISYISKFIRTHVLAVGILLSGWTCLFLAWWWKAPLMAAVAPAGQNLPLNEGIFTYARKMTDFVLIALNHVVFSGPWQPAVANGMANLSAHMAIGFSTYALARRYAWPPMAITVALLVISMPRLVHQSLSANSELLPAAAAVCAILALYRAVEEPHARDLAMLFCVIGFSVYGEQLCYVLPVVLTGLSILVLARRYEARLWLKTLIQYPGTLLVVAVVTGVFSQITVVAINLANGRSWIGSVAADVLVYNQDGLAGAAANMVRYLLQSIHLPEWSDQLCQWGFGFSALGYLKQFYAWSMAALAGDKGAAAVFELSWAPGNPYGWFGPAGFLLVTPSLVYALARGPYRLKTTALAMWVYWALVALIAAWQPANVHLMTVFFTVSGFVTAFFLPPWHIGRNGCMALQLVGIVVAFSEML